ncbi:MAG: DEAD/DEAH box helicase family protein [Chromatiaceae bacterium]|nr:DEAD/DEAH box helicase family protein [Chromatiaceae bacterium]
MLDLYPHQAQVIADLSQGIRQGHTRQIVGLATGAGKTIVAAHLGHRAAQKGKKMLFIVHTIELAGQAVETFARLGLSVGILRGEDTNYSHQDEIIVASIQSIRSRSAPDWMDFGIIDECHVLHQEHKRLMTDWHDRPFIGLSATPLTKGLGQIFTHLVRGPSIRELTEGKFLVPVRAYAPCADAVLAALADVTCGTTVGGYDYKENELALAMNSKGLIGDIVKTWQEKGEDRPTLCFAINVAHSQSIRDDFIASGVSAAHLDYRTEASERRDIIAAFKAGTIKLLTSVNVLGTGFNVPDAGCLILARPTLSLALHIQQCGRGLRIAPGKDDCIILDHSGNCLKHGLPHHFTVPDLDMGDKPDPAKAKKRDKPPFIACRHCGAIMDPDEITCPRCGLDRPVRASRIVSREGELVAFGSAANGSDDGTQEDPKDFYRMAMGYCLAHGQKPRRAYHLTAARHPAVRIPWNWGDLPPLTPSPAVARWIKNRNLYDRIRYQRGAA